MSARLQPPETSHRWATVAKQAGSWCIIGGRDLSHIRSVIETARRRASSGAV